MSGQKPTTLKQGTVGGKTGNKGCAGMKGGASYSLIGGLDGNNGIIGDNVGNSLTHEVIGKQYAGVFNVQQHNNQSNMNAANIRKPDVLNTYEQKIVNEKPTMLGGSGGAAYGFKDINGNMSDFAGSYAPITPVSNSMCETSLSGGSNGKKIHICHDLNKIKSYKQVQDFWKSICPGAVMLYESHLKQLENKLKTKNEVFRIVKLYTRVFCEEVKALQSNVKKHSKESIKLMKINLEKIEKLLHKLAPNSISQHKMVANRHINTVRNHMNKLSKNKTQKNKMTKHKMSKHNKSKTLKSSTIKHNNKSKTTKNKKSSNKKNKKTKKIMKGGYAQYLGGTPLTPSYGFDGSGALQGGLLTTPHPIKGMNGCVDNYDHFTGKGFKTPVLDQNVVSK